MFRGKEEPEKNEGKEEEKEETAVEKKSSYSVAEMKPADIGDSIRINDDVLLTIVRVVVSEIDGVSIAPGGIVGGILKKGGSRGIKIESSDKEVKVEITVNLQYGTRIPEAAAKIQTSVRKALEDMTGKYVKSVGIFVEGVRLPSDKESIDMKLKGQLSDEDEDVSS